MVSEVWKGSHRVLGIAQHGKAPLIAEQVRSLIRGCPGNLLGFRGRALTMAGFAGGCRSEAAAIDLIDLSFDDYGVLINLRKLTVQ